MTVTWEIDDGYAGGNRPHETEIDDDELAECETIEDKKQLIREYVQSDFSANIDWYITDWGDLNENN